MASFKTTSSPVKFLFWVTVLEVVLILNLLANKVCLICNLMTLRMSLLNLLKKLLCTAKLWISWLLSAISRNR